MTNETKQLIELISSYQLDIKNIPIELVFALQGLIGQIEQAHSDAIYFDENGEEVSSDLRKFLLSGLTNIDYITSKYFKIL